MKSDKVFCPNCGAVFYEVVKDFVKGDDKYVAMLKCIHCGRTYTHKEILSDDT